MKNLILVLFIILSPAITLGQNTPPKGAKKILVTDTLSKEQNFKLILNKLIDDGWQIASKDLEYGTIETKPKKLEKENFDTIYNFVVKDNRVIFTGKLNNNLEINFGGINSTSTWMDIYYSGGFYIFRPAFEKMIKFAGSLNPSKIEYE